MSVDVWPDVVPIFPRALTARSVVVSSCGLPNPKPVPESSSLSRNSCVVQLKFCTCGATVSELKFVKEGVKLLPLKPLKSDLCPLLTTSCDDVDDVADFWCEDDEAAELPGGAGHPVSFLSLPSTR